MHVYALHVGPSGAVVSAQPVKIRHDARRRFRSTSETPACRSARTIAWRPRSTKIATTAFSKNPNMQNMFKLGETR